MRQWLAIQVGIALAMTLACNPIGDPERDSPVGLTANDFSFRRLSPGALNGLGQYVKAVKLGNHSDALIGGVDLVKIHSGTGDIWVGDFDSTKRIYRFGSNGGFLRGYGNVGEGPGEYQRIRGFDVLADSSPVLLAGGRRVIRFDPRGKLLATADLSFWPNDLVAVQAKIYLTSNGRTSNENAGAFYILNESLQLEQSLGELDWRIDKYTFSPIFTAVSLGGNAYFLAFYHPWIYRYDPASGVLTTIKFNDLGEDLTEVWAKERFTEEDRKRIRSGVHRFSTVLANDELLFLWETFRNGDLSNYWLLDPERKTVDAFAASHLFPAEADDLYPNRIVGGDGRDFIFLLDDPERFAAFKHRHPALADIEFGNEDNPVLAWFRFNR